VQDALRGRELLLEPVAEAGLGHARVGAGDPMSPLPPITTIFMSCLSLV
jgi:hypothetical protein